MRHAAHGPAQLARPLLAAMAFTTIACGAADDRGDLVIHISGEGAAKLGYPFVKNNETIAFVDGWRVRFDKFLVGLAEVRLAATRGAEVSTGAQTMVADLRLGDPEVVRWTALEARRWDRFGFRIVAPQADARALNRVADADRARMTEGGFNYWIEGRAEKNGETFTFTWGLRNPTRNTSCTNGLDGTDGFVVRNHATAQGEITIHVDHLFWDTLGGEVSRLRFDAIAGASRDDFDVTFEELAAQSLASPRGRDGQPLLDERGQPLSYNPGSVPIGAPNLASFILASSASQAHVNGLGLCTVSRL